LCHEAEADLHDVNSSRDIDRRLRTYRPAMLSAYARSCTLTGARSAKTAWMNP